MTLNTVDLFYYVVDLLQNQCQTAEIEFCPGDEDVSDCISISAEIDEMEVMHFADLYDINSPDYEPPETLSPEPAPYFFSTDELDLIKSALSDGKTHCSEQLKSVALSATDRSSVSRKMKSYEALLNEISFHLRALQGSPHK